MTAKLTQQGFIDKAIERHGDRYDYSQSVFVSTREPVTVVCRVHGAFTVNRANDHLQGSGCRKCVIESISDTTESFIEKARAIHGGKYSYKKVVHKGANTRVIITCPVHGDWKQTPGSHIAGHGCQKCTREKIGNYKRGNTGDFIEKASGVHAGRYSYDRVIYRGRKYKVIITCPDHGDFEQEPSNHLAGHGCPRCKANGVSDRLRSNTEDFIVKAKLVHHDLYDYSKTQYTTNRTPVVVICPEHGEFLQVPNYHLEGNGCPNCFSRSNTEMHIANLLDEWGIPYEKEAKFPDCKNKRPLPFDFKVIIGDSFFLIEYHGSHHYQPIARFGGEEKLRTRQKHDAIKEQWAKDRGIRLVAIPYWERKNIGVILQGELKRASNC